MWKCHRCETQNQSDALHCIVCGQPYAQNDAWAKDHGIGAGVTPSSGALSHPWAAAPPPPKFTPPPPDPKGPKSPLPIMGIFMFLIIPLFILYLMIWGSGQGEGFTRNREAAGTPPSVTLSPPSKPPRAAPEVPWDIPSMGAAVYGRDSMGLPILWAQAQLQTLGYYTQTGHDLTGSLGDRTAREVDRFQQDHGLLATGKIDRKTIEAIAQAQDRQGVLPVAILVGGYYDSLPALQAPGLKAADRGEAVQWVQTCLQALGYDIGAVDGRFGSKTEKAVSAFQKDWGYFPTGTVKLGILRRMLEVYVQQGHRELLDGSPGP